MGTSETLRSVLDAGRGSKRLDELGIARVIQLVAAQMHAAEVRAGNTSIGPVTPQAIALAPDASVELRPAAPGASGYRAPEQITGTGDRRSDVFSLGVVMWEALTNQRLFAAGDEATRDVQLPSELNANIPAELAAICMKALAKNPPDRYQSVKVMGVELEEFLREAGYPEDNAPITEYLASTAKAAPPAPSRAPAPAPAPTPPAAPPAALAATTPASAPAVTPTPPPSILTTPAPAAPTAPVEPAKPTPAGTQPPPIAADPHPLTGGATLLGIAKPDAPAPAPPVVPAPAEPAKPAEPASAEPAPHPAAAVALGHAPRTRAESQGEVLSNWAWKTDSQTAIDDEDFHAPSTSTRKLVTYLIGGGVAFAGLVAIIMFGFGGHHAAKKAPAAAKQTEPTQVASTAPGSAATAPATAPAPAPAPTADTPAPAAGSAAAPGSDTAAPAAGSATPDEPAAGSSAGSDAGSAQAETSPTPPAPPPPAPPPPTKPTKPTKPAETHSAIAHTSHERSHERPQHKADRATAEAANREGLMKFARGETGAALASLRRAVAADPGFAPTWRTMGMVYEKMGERQAASASFRHYLQLEPGAADAGQIRQRLERLGS